MTRVDQPLCDDCQNYKDGACHMYRNNIELHGEIPIDICGSHLPFPKKKGRTDSSGDTAGKEK